MRNNLYLAADVNWQATITGIARDAVLDFGLCISWDKMHPHAMRITGKHDQMKRFFEHYDCMVLEELEEVKSSRIAYY